MTEDRSRALRAVLRTALIWGAAWAIAGGGIVAILSVLNPAPGVASLAGRVGMAALAGVSWGVRFGIAGVVIGTVFSTVIRLGYRGRRLRDIDPVRFALLGAVIGGVGVPLFLQGMNVLTGGKLIAWNLVSDDAVWASVFGAAVAAGSILLARRADALAPAPRHDELGHGEDLTAAPPAQAEAPIRRRSPPARP
jgi:MFS family permease